MTEYFEVHHRDGPARIGELRLDSPITTPALIGDQLADGGSLWTKERSPPEGDTDCLTVLPHRALPAGADERLQTAFPSSSVELETPSAAVISPTSTPPQSVDAYVLSGAAGLLQPATTFVETITAIRELIPHDTALLASGVATPATVAILTYAGVDLFDDHRAVIRGTQGRYLTLDGERRLENLSELPCACPACTGTAEAFDREQCVEHNRNMLRASLALVRERIRNQTLRDYLTAAVRHSQWATGILRRLDAEWDYIEQRTPILRRAEITATTDDTLRRVEIKRFAERVINRYEYRFDSPIVLLPCSARKPYSDSQSHAQFRDAIQWRGHMVSMTSPIGIVPGELELTYPAQHYDTVVTGHWSESELSFVADILHRFLSNIQCPQLIAHIPPEGYRTVVERATESLDIPIEYTVDEHPTTDASLEALAESLTETTPFRKREREHNTIKAIADYQFGPGAGDELFDSVTIQGPYPKYRVVDGDEQLAALVPEYGFLALGLAGARRWLRSDLDPLCVEIDDFVPHGSVLAPGIISATEGIRIGDEVLIDGPDAFGVGRAVMSGPEMNSSTRGVAVDVRHITEQ